MKKLMLIMFISVFLITLVSAGSSKYTGFENGQLNNTDFAFLYSITSSPTGAQTAQIVTNVTNSGTYSVMMGGNGSRQGIYNGTENFTNFFNSSIYLSSLSATYDGAFEMWSGTGKTGSYMVFALKQGSDCGTGKICTYNGATWAESSITANTSNWDNVTFIINSSGVFSFYDKIFIRKISTATSIGTIVLTTTDTLYADNLYADYVIPPTPNISVTNQTMPFNSDLTLNLSSYANNTDYINISLKNPDDNQTEYLNTTNANTLLTSYFSIINNNSVLNVHSYDSNYTMIISAYPCSNTYGCGNTSVFNVTIKESISPTAQNPLVSIADYSSSILPNKDNLNFKTRLIIIAGLLLLLTLAGLIGLDRVGITGKGKMALVGLGDSLLILFFVSIGYISIWLVIGIILVIVGIPVLVGNKNG